MATLLEKAISQRNSKRVKANQEDIDLALAWLQDKVITFQVAKAYGVNGGNVYSRLAVALKSAFNKGQVKVREEAVGECNDKKD